MNALISFLWSRCRRSKKLVHIVWILLLVVVADGYWFGFDHVKRLFSAIAESRAWVQSGTYPEHRDDRGREHGDVRTPKPVHTGKSGFLAPHGGHDKHKEEHDSRNGWR